MKDVSILTNNGVNVQQSLELFGDMEMYNETLNDFLDMLQEKLTNLEKHRIENDMPNYAIEVHALKSDARYLGFLTLGDMAYESEMKSKAGDSSFVNENHVKILKEVKRVVNVAETYLGRPLTTNFPGLVENSIDSQTATVSPQPVMQQTAPQTATVSPQPVMQQTAPQTATVSSQPVMQQTAPQVATVSSQPAMQQTAPQVATVSSQPAMQQTAPQVAAVSPQPVMQQSISQEPLMPAQQHTVQPQMTMVGANESSEIQFFPSNNTNNIMDQSLFSMNQANVVQQTAVPSVKQGIILIIDDSNLVANFVKKIFSDKYEVLVANDGAKGIEIANDPNIRPKIKTCLVDLYMPNVDGFQVLENFKENGIFVKTPVAIISGAEDVESIERAKAYPIIDILAKPFTDRDVKMVVEKCLAVYF